ANSPAATSPANPSPPSPGPSASAKPPSTPASNPTSPAPTPRTDRDGRPTGGGAADGRAVCCSAQKGHRWWRSRISTTRRRCSRGEEEMGVPGPGRAAAEVGRDRADTDPGVVPPPLTQGGT